MARLCFNLFLKPSFPNGLVRDLARKLESPSLLMTRMKALPMLREVWLRRKRKKKKRRRRKSKLHCPFMIMIIPSKQ